MLADDLTCLFERAADVHIVLDCRDIRPRNGKGPKDVVHLPRVVFRSGAFGGIEFRLGEHLEGNENFGGWIPKEFLPDRVGTTAKASDEDVGIDEAGHLLSSIKGGSAAAPANYWR